MSDFASNSLEIVDDSDPHARPIRIEAGRRLLIGRESDCDMCIEHPAVSRHHAALVATDSGVVVEDLGSRHGTRVNGELLQARAGRTVVAGDVIHIGPHALRVRVSGGDAETEIKIDGSRTMSRMAVGRGGGLLELVNESRPDVDAIPLKPGQRLVVGRLPECDVAVDDPAVSRNHAALVTTEAGTTVEDLGSRHGTRVNGQFARQGRPIEVSEGDVVQVGPRLLRIRAAKTRVRAEAGTESPDLVRTIAIGAQGSAEHTLRVLVEVVRSIPADGTAESAVAMVLKRLLSVTNLERALLVRFDELRADADIIASAGPEGRAVSRTVLASSSDPSKVARLSQSNMDVQSAASIAGTGVREVLCARVMVEGDEQLYLYLDSAAARAPVDAAMAEFVGAAARICGLVIESFARRRLEALRIDVERARLVQRRLLSEEDGSFGDFSWSLHSLPGMMLAGDFAGIAQRPDGSLLAWLGDVSGKGAAAAMLMASSQAWMFAAATRVEPPDESIRGLNRFLCARSEPSEFATLFAVVLDANGTLTICDAGHGIAFMSGAGAASRIEAEGGPPVGVAEEAEYGTSSLALAKGARLVLATDGIFEQRSPKGDMFGLERIASTVAGSKETRDDVARLFEALRAHAEGPFDDDASVLSIARK